MHDDTPTMDEDDILPWQDFIRDFHSRDLPYNQEVKDIIEANKSERIDFRPYMIENPMTVTSSDKFLKCTELFRKMHLRSLIVIDPSDASLKGIITREDLFRFLDL